jgi:hypothetical protein
MLCATLLMGLLVWASQAAAHLMPAQQGALHVQGASVRAMVALPVSALNQVDDDGDGRLSGVEAQRHLERIKDQVQARLRIFNGDTPGRLDQLQILAEEDEKAPPQASPAAALSPSAGATHFLMLMKVSFAGAPDQLHLAVDLFGTAPRERQLTLKVTRGEDTEAVVLTPPIQLTLEYAVEFISDDELVEVTPESIRIRKRYLTENERKRSHKAEEPLVI